MIDPLPEDDSPLETLKLRAVHNYPAIWARVIAEWQQSDSGDHVWLTYAANYLLNIARVRCAIDPFSMSTRVSGIQEPAFQTDLQDLELVLLTHEHNDHLDMCLIASICDLPIQWVIPEFMKDRLFRAFPSLRHKSMVPQPGIPFSFKGIQFTPFNSLHFHGNSGVPELGYLVEFNQKKWLFPGDIRNYDRSSLPVMGSLTGSFAHLWLGKAAAMEQNPPFLDAFCRFFVDLNPEHLVVTHLYEFGRDENDLWTDSHFQRIKNNFHKMTSEIQIKSSIMGDHIDL